MIYTPFGKRSLRTGDRKAERTNQEWSPKVGTARGRNEDLKSEVYASQGFADWEYAMARHVSEGQLRKLKLLEASYYKRK